MGHEMITRYNRFKRMVTDTSYVVALIFLTVVCLALGALCYQLLKAFVKILWALFMGP